MLICHSLYSCKHPSWQYIGPAKVCHWLDVQEMVGSSRIGADESINDYAGKTEEEINELLAAKVSSIFWK